MVKIKSQQFIPSLRGPAAIAKARKEGLILWVFNQQKGWVPGTAETLGRAERMTAWGQLIYGV